MKKQIASLLPILCLAALSMTAKADDTLKLTSDNSSPYTLSLDGGAGIKLFCIDDFLTVSTGESWNVDVVAGAQLSSMFSGNTLKQYDEEAYIYSLLGSQIAVTVNHHTTMQTVDANSLQEALWVIFDPHENNVDPDAIANALVAAAGSANISTAVIDAATFYIPDGGVKNAQWGDSSTPQTFIGSTPISPAPEPSSLVLLGSGLVGIAGAVRRKMGRA